MYPSNVALLPLLDMNSRRFWRTSTLVTCLTLTLGTVVLTLRVILT